MPHDAASARISPRRSSRTSAAPRSTASRTVAGPTFGFPSRSPPIHVPNRSGDPGSRACQTRCSSAAASQRLSSTNHSPCRISSTTRGRSERTSSVCQRIVTSSTSRSLASARSRGVERGSSSSSRSSSRRRCFSRIVRGSASVGWAVRTSSTDTRRAASRSSSSPTPAAASSASASSSDSRRVPPSRSISRRRRTRWCCSAMFARWKYIVNARRITACVETGSAAIAVASEREAVASPSRPRRASPRIRSSSRNVSAPSCSTSTRPRVSPSRRTSDLSDPSSACSVGALITPL